MGWRTLILVVVTAMLLAACGGGGGEGDNPAAGVEPGGEEPSDELIVESDAPTRTPVIEEVNDFIGTPDLTAEAEATLETITDSESGDLFAADSTSQPGDSFTGGEGELFGDDDGGGT